jgi:hypothetical protein
MPVIELLKELSDEIASVDEPLRNLAALEIWCARVRAIVLGAFPEKAPELDRLLSPLATAALPRLAPRPEITAGPPTTIRATLVGGDVLKARLLAFIQGLAANAQVKRVPRPENDSPHPKRPVPGKPTPWVFVSSVRREAEPYRNAFIAGGAENDADGPAR